MLDEDEKTKKFNIHDLFDTRGLDMSSWDKPLKDRFKYLLNYWADYLEQASMAGFDLQATMDFETRSACDLKKHGSWIYSKHPTTRAMVLRYRLPDMEPGEVGIWHMAHPDALIAESPPPLDLFAYLISGGLIEAHNAFFERVIWANVMVKQHGWPAINHEQWRCSAARASACSIPRDLEGAGQAMGLAMVKDMVGNRLMKKMSKPRKPRKDEITAWMDEEGLTGDYRRYATRFTEANGYLWHEEEDELYRLWDYCRDDVLTEEALSNSLPELSRQELLIWQMDQDMNWKGAKFDLALAKAALDMAARWRKRLNHELEQMTGIASATKRQAVKDWLLEHEGIELPDTAADTLEWYIEHEPISGRARRVMEITMDVNRTSTRKYQAMLDKCDPDDWRARDLLMYHGAGTGRWSGKGIQVHNFPARDLIIGGQGKPSFEEAAADVLSGDLDWCVAMYGDVMKLLSHVLRAAIIPEEELMVADYSAIEARCVLWEAYADKALQIFYTGGDIYCDMATGIYGFEVKKKEHPNERQFGKQAILGLGYGMGYLTFLLTCRKYKIYFSRADVLRIMGKEKLEKYEGWVKDTLCLSEPPNFEEISAEDVKKYKNKRKQAAKTIRRIRDAREDPKKITHELALMKYTVDVYRNRYPEVKQLWKDQELAAIEAVQQWEALVKKHKEKAQASWEKENGKLGPDNVPFGLLPWETVQFRDTIEGPTVECGRIKWYVKRGFLHCELPSGRPIRYRDPEIKNTRTSWGELKPALRYMSVDGTTRKWVRTATYGGKIVENITQAVARDIMANAMLLAYEGGVYFTIMSVHDELVCEVSCNEGSVEDFEELMSSIPAWAYGCPITAEAERLKRYKK